jgi:hypothetical protein
MITGTIVWQYKGCMGSINRLACETKQTSMTLPDVVLVNDWVSDDERA